MNISKVRKKSDNAYLLGYQNKSGKKSVEGWTTDRGIAVTWERQSNDNLSAKISYSKFKSVVPKELLADPAYLHTSTHQFIPPLVCINSDYETEFLEMFYTYFDSIPHLIRKFLYTIPALKFSEDGLRQMGELLFLLAKISKMIETGDLLTEDEQCELEESEIFEYPREYDMFITDMYDYHMGYLYWLETHHPSKTGKLDYNDVKEKMRKVLTDAAQQEEEIRQKRHE